MSKFDPLCVTSKTTISAPFLESDLIAPTHFSTASTHDVINILRAIHSSGQRVHAIKLARIIFNCSLSDATRLVEANN